MDNQNPNSCCNWQGHKKYLVHILSVLFVVLALNFLVRTITEIKGWKGIDNNQNTVSFTETGEIYAKPDLAVISFSVITEKKTVADATAENSQKINAVIEKIKAEGVNDKDLKTTSYNIFPLYDYAKTEIQMYSYPSGNRILTGYSVTQSLEVKIRDLDKIGKIIETATAAGANEAENLQLTIDKEDDLKKEARKQAIDKAKLKAKELSGQLGVKLSRIVSFSDNYYSPMYYYGEAKGMGGGHSDSSVPAPQIETGENKILVTVTITYQIN